MNRLIFLLMLPVILAACSTLDEPQRSHDPQTIVNKTWQWQGTVTPVETIVSPNPERYTMKLSENGRAEVRFDCNRGGGNYQISDGKLSFSPMISTRMACPEGGLDYLFGKQLQEVVSFFIENDELYLELPVDAGTMRFRLQP